MGRRGGGVGGGGGEKKFLGTHKAFHLDGHVLLSLFFSLFSPLFLSSITSQKHVKIKLRDGIVADKG